MGTTTRGEYYTKSCREMLYRLAVQLFVQQQECVIQWLDVRRCLQKSDLRRSTLYEYESLSNVPSLSSEYNAFCDMEFEWKASAVATGVNNVLICVCALNMCRLAGC